MAWKIILVVALVVVVAAVVGYSQVEAPKTVPGEESVQVEEKTGREEGERGAAIPASGSVDDAAAAALFDAELDASLFAEETADAALLDTDGQAVGDFGGVYDEREF